MKVAVYPGSFDPITNGHLDIIKRASKIFDRLIVAVACNPNKVATFTVAERMELIKKAVGDLPNVEVDHFEGLLVDFMKKKNASVIIKGLRAVSDFEYEFQMALMNRKLDPNIETLFMMTSYKYSYLSSSIVKEIGKLGGCIGDLVPEVILPDIQKKLISS
ncbi:pantetheine-phosphate adenylyltransferase [Caldicoprobacter guelmensis]|uniref:pantetheine-phosphate adenylyltransferase n=1 Tax=Caldicoprobacter guelmensis TaxID=1170224 RepID=UPI001959A5B5|nr:pantetheine-phosphate adenylyltransferase [Caldicoprobacter guelmensis]MBM7581912.1 pantetheine-phosphate adenylyltransferase [Caldicoprobacter guelmensis]